MDRGTIMHPQIRLRGIDGKQSLWFPDPDRPLLSITISNPLKMLPICFHRGLWVSPTNRAFSGPAARSGHLGPPRTTGRRPSAVGCTRAHCARSCAEAQPRTLQLAHRQPQGLPITAPQRPSAPHVAQAAKSSHRQPSHGSCLDRLSRAIAHCYA